MLSADFILLAERNMGQHEIHHDLVAAEAVGGHVDELPKGYYWSPGFIGTFIVSTAQAATAAMSP